MAGNEAEGQIAAHVFREISSFETFLSTLNTRLAENATAASHFARFKLWVGSMGAHRSSGGRSLEYRLRDASAVESQVVSLLQDLNDSLAHGANFEGSSFEEGVSEGKEDDASSDPTDAELEDYFRDEEKSGVCELADVLEDIGHVVDCLLRLSSTIRNPAPHDHFRSRAGTHISSLYEEWDIKHTREKFPNAASEIIERLGKASAQRRQYFKYREDHTNRLAEGLVLPLEITPSEFGGSLPEKATTIASSIPNYLKEKEIEALSTSSKYAQFSDSESIASMTSYAPSGVHHGQLRVPSLPKESSIGPFKCPFCCLIISVNSKQEWKKHVFRDLRPYVCTERFCTKPDQQYQRRADWMAHMREEHWKIWACPFGCPDVFHSSKSFTLHIMGEHPAEIPARRLDTLEDLSSHFDARRIEDQCPLCGDFRVATEKQFGTHVGNHLEQLALFALPNHGGEGRNEDDSKGSNHELAQDWDGQSSDSSLRYEGGAGAEHNEKLRLWDRQVADAVDTLELGEPFPLDGRDSSGSQGYDSDGDSADGSAPPLIGSNIKPETRGADTVSEDPDATVEEERGVDPKEHSNVPKEFVGGPSHKDNDDIVSVEFENKRAPEFFPPGSISNGTTSVQDLIHRVIARYWDFVSPYTNDKLSPDQLVIFFKDRIYTGTAIPLCDIGVRSHSEVKVLLLTERGPHPPMLISLVVATILSEMEVARSKCKGYLEDHPSSGKLSEAAYTEARIAVGGVFGSLSEFKMHTDSELMRCWESEMMAQASALLEAVNRKSREGRAPAQASGEPHSSE